MKSLHMIVDMQFGSCGKGLFAGFLANKVQPDTIVTAWAPNAGHTYMDKSWPGGPLKMVNIALPNGIVAGSVRRVLLGPGSVVNPELLMSELERYADLMGGVDLLIHEHAAVVTEDHRQQEAAYAFKLGSTMKGVGAAVTQKIRRDPDALNIARHALKGTPLEGFVVDVETYNGAIDRAETVLVEGAQGFSLSMNQGFYPYTTSRDCTVQQLMVDCALPATQPAYGRTVHGVCRTYPIRVANRQDKDGNQIGWSGPHYPDQEEIKWEDIGLEPELTTVTRLPRRIFTFSAEQIKQAVRMNGINNVFLNFVNYPMYRIHDGKLGGYGSGLNGNLTSMIRCINDTGATVRWLGHGPDVSDIKEL